MKILITGCARSGTTLLLYLSQFFSDVQAMLDDEYVPTRIKMKDSRYFVKRQKRKKLIIKYPMHDSGSRYHIPLKKVLDYGFYVVAIIRDGRDVLVSKHPPELVNFHVEPKRWVETNLELIEFKKNKKMMTVRYEDIISNTEAEMNKIGKFIRSDFLGNYNDFYKNISSGMKDAMGTKGARPISSDSIANWRLLENRDRLKSIVSSKYINKICDLLIYFGYEKNKEWCNSFI